MYIKWVVTFVPRKTFCLIASWFRPTTREICGVLLFASGTYIEAGVLQTGLQHGLKIVTPTRWELSCYFCCINVFSSHRVLLVRCESHTDMKWVTVYLKLLIHCTMCREWRAAIKAVLEGPARSLVKQHRFDSFAPVRNNCQTQWYAFLLQ